MIQQQNLLPRLVAHKARPVKPMNYPPHIMITHNMNMRICQTELPLHIFASYELHYPILVLIYPNSLQIPPRLPIIHQITAKYNRKISNDRTANLNNRE
jgi:hypothetical protein